MLNAIWILMIVAALICGGLTGTMQSVSQASADSAKAAVQLVIGLVGVMAFWLGLMRVLQRGGLLRSMARLVKPVTSRLFPDIPAEHPAMSMMVMNILSNMLGLGNAATPFGLKAMVELNKLNPHKGTATNSMALFLAINTSNIALLPTGIIALRASLGSTSPGSIILPSLIATSCSTLIAIVVAKSLQRLKLFSLPKNLPTGEAGPPSSAEKQSEASRAADSTDGVDSTNEADVTTADDEESADIDISEAEKAIEDQRKPVGPVVRLLGWAAVAGVVAAFVIALYRNAFPESGAQPGLMDALNTAITEWPLALLIVAIVLYGLLRGVHVYDAVVEGGREAFKITLRFVPYFITILVGIGMLRASGAIERLVDFLTPLTSAIGMPAETLPMAILRPLSGSGAYGVAAEIMKQHGPDSLIGSIVSTMQGSTETTFYVLALYYGVVAIKNTRHTIAACLIADVTGILAAVWACRLLLL